MWAFIDAGRNVLAISTVARTVAEAQIKNPTVTKRIIGAPDGLKCKANCSSAEVEYHQLKEGAGGQVINDYDLLEELTAYKAVKCETIDAKTEELCLSGYHYVNEVIPADVWFSTSEHAQLNWTGLKELVNSMHEAGILDEQIFPMKMPTKALDGGNWECPNYAVYLDICIKMGLARGTIVTSGQDIKTQVKNAATKVDVDAIIDPR